MTKVYIVIYDVPDDPSELLKVFSNKDKAVEFAKDLTPGYYSTLDFNPDFPDYKTVYHSHNGLCAYSVVECDVE